MLDVGARRFFWLIDGFRGGGMTVMMEEGNSMTRSPDYRLWLK